MNTQLLFLNISKFNLMEKKAQLMSFCMGAIRFCAVVLFLFVGMSQTNAQSYLSEGQALTNLSNEAEQLVNQQNSATPGSTTYYQLDRKITLFKMVADNMFSPGQTTETAATNALAQFRPAGGTKQSGVTSTTLAGMDMEATGSTPSPSIPVASATEFQDLKTSLMQLVSN